MRTNITLSHIVSTINELGSTKTPFNFATAGLEAQVAVVYSAARSTFRQLLWWREALERAQSEEPATDNAAQQSRMFQARARGECNRYQAILNSQLHFLLNLYHYEEATDAHITYDLGNFSAEDGIVADDEFAHHVVGMKRQPHRWAIIACLNAGMVPAYALDAAPCKENEALAQEHQAYDFRAVRQSGPLQIEDIDQLLEQKAKYAIQRWLEVLTETGDLPHDRKASLETIFIGHAKRVHEGFASPTHLRMWLLRGIKKQEVIDRIQDMFDVLEEREDSHIIDTATRILKREIIADQRYARLAAQVEQTCQMVVDMMPASPARNERIMQLITAQSYLIGPVETARLMDQFLKAEKPAAPAAGTKTAKATGTKAKTTKAKSTKAADAKAAKLAAAGTADPIKAAK